MSGGRGDRPVRCKQRGALRDGCERVCGVRDGGSERGERPAGLYLWYAMCHVVHGSLNGSQVGTARRDTGDTVCVELC